MNFLNKYFKLMNAVEAFLIGILLGILLGIGSCVFVESSDTTINVESVEKVEEKPTE